MSGTSAGARLLWSLLRRNRPSTPLGAGRGDRHRLADSRALAHIADALVDGGERTAADLLRRRLAFAHAPDPSPWLRAQSASNPLAADDAVPLRVLCWNLALLDVYIGRWHYKASPYVAQRTEPVFDRLLGAGADILLVQELWHPPQIARLAERAPAAGYRVFCPPRPHVDGLAVLLREGLFLGQPEVELRPYATQDRLEALELPMKERFLRSWLRVSFDHPVLGRLAVFDTHMQAYPKAWCQRLQQARALGLEVAARPADELVILGGDLNAGSFYGRQTWRRPGAVIDGFWWHDALSLPALHHYGGLSDLVIRGRAVADADLEVRESRALVNDPVAALAGPLDCSADHRRAFTATDCNSLYHQQYAGTEQAARIDHLLARDPDDRIHVAASRHCFTQPDVAVDGVLVEPSDHYAVLVDLRVAPPR